MAATQTSGFVDTQSRWDPTSRILRTALRGNVTVEDVTAWRRGLAEAVEEIPDGAHFGLLLNLVGFDPVDLEAHKSMRTVVPELLAAHGMRPAFLDLFEERPEVPISVERGVRVTAFANVHHDAEKMGRYEELIGRPGQKFFTDASEADDWIRSQVGLPLTANA